MSNNQHPRRDFIKNTVATVAGLGVAVIRLAWSRPIAEALQASHTQDELLSGYIFLSPNLLGFLLFHEAEKKKDTKDAILFNGLVSAWGDVNEQARKYALTPRSSQQEFDFDEDED